MKTGRPDPKLHRDIAAYAKGKRVLDIGCGNKAYSTVSANVVTLDGWDKTDPDVLLNLEEDDLPFEEGAFGCVLMLDLIEHLSKERGAEILEQAKRVTSGRVYVFTPSWWDTNESHTNDPNCWAYQNELNVHKSFWPPEDFAKPQWTSIGHKTADGEFFWGYWEK